MKTGKIPNRQRSASNDKINGDDASISKAAEVNDISHLIDNEFKHFKVLNSMLHGNDIQGI